MSLNDTFSNLSVTNKPLPSADGLTEAQQQRLSVEIDGILRDMTHEQIAASLGVSRSTVQRDLRLVSVSRLDLLVV